jgi:formylglycine-generating enzyme required for sulfatase activity
MAVLKRVCEESPPPIREINPKVPEWLCDVISRLHAKRPADRFASATELADLLALYLSELERHGTVQPLASAPPPVKGAPFRWLLLARAVGVLAMLVLVAMLVVHSFQRPPGDGPADPKAPVVLDVQASQVWQDTGVDVVEGEAVVLVPRGTWRKGRQTCSAEGLRNAPRTRAVWPDAPLLCLLVRVGDEPTAAAVGQREVFKPRRSGRLFVQANDLDLEGNAGSLELTMTGGLRLGDAAPAPGLLPIQAAERAWKPLLARAEAPGVPPEQARAAIIDFCGKFAGIPQAFRAGQLLCRLPLVVNTLGMKLVPIPPGSFLMGSPADEPSRMSDEGQHEVLITRPFYMGIHDVTVGQFKAFVKETSYRTEAEKSDQGAHALLPSGEWQLDPRVSWRSPGFEQTHEHPVVCVSWNDATAFCTWLSRKEGKHYALPTEAQWEHSCRAGSGTKFFFGDSAGELGQYAWYGENSELKTHPVGQKKPNGWGLFDMHGNVYTWTADWYAADYYPSSPRADPPGPRSGTARVLRGGDWHGGVE